MNGDDSVIEGKSGVSYLNIKSVRKMLNKLLLEKKIDKIMLAKILGITVTELNKLLFCDPTVLLVKKVNLPLVKVYCETKFD